MLLTNSETTILSSPARNDAGTIKAPFSSGKSAIFSPVCVLYMKIFVTFCVFEMLKLIPCPSVTLRPYAGMPFRNKHDEPVHPVRYVTPTMCPSSASMTTGGPEGGGVGGGVGGGEGKGGG